MHKRWKFWNTSFQYICQKTQIYTQLVEFTFKHIVSKSTQKSVKHERKVSSRRCCPSMLHDHFIDLPPILEKKEKKISIKLKNIIYIYIYNTMMTIYTIIDSFYKKKKNTYKTILLEDCTIKQRKIKLKFKENQKIT